MTFHERLDEIIPHYQDGLSGSAPAVQETHRLLEQLRREYPNQPLADAYHGSTMILIARDNTKALEKLKWSKDGMKLLDKAVTAEPEDGMIRMLRGKAAYALPEKYFGRTMTAIEDYTFLIRRALRQEGLFEPAEYAQLLDELGDSYCRIGRNRDASRCWERLAKQTDDPSMRKRAEQKLKALEGRPDVEEVEAPVSPSGMMFGAVARATGKALHRWVEKEKEKERDRKRRKKKERRH